MRLPARSFTVLISFAAACGPSNQADDLLDVNVLDESLVSSVACASPRGLQALCSGSGDLQPSAARIGASTSAQADVVQVFSAASGGTAKSVWLKLRALRVPSPGQGVSVEVRAANADGSPDAAGALVASGTASLSGLLSKATDVEVPLTITGAGQLSAGGRYALLVKSTVPASGTTLVGVGTHTANVLANESTWRRSSRGSTLGNFVAMNGGDVSFRFEFAECSSGLTWAETTCLALPAAPTIASSAPASPSARLEPLLSGSAPADATVRLYTSPDCLGTPVSTATANGTGAWSTTVTVPGSAATTLRATATVGGVASPCSAAFTYVNQAATSCAQILAVAPSSTSGAYAVSHGQGTTHTVACDMTTEGGGWELVMRGQQTPTVPEGIPSASTIGYMPAPVMTALAAISHDIMIRESGTSSWVRTNYQGFELTPILNLRNGNSPYTSHYEYDGSYWLGSGAGSPPDDRLWTSCTGPRAHVYPSVIYWACNNGGGLHWLAESSNWQGAAAALTLELWMR